MLKRMGNRQFPALEPGKAWLGPLWPNNGAGFGLQQVAFGSSPHPSPGAYKRRSAEPLTLCFALFFSAPSALRWLLLVASAL